MAISNQIKRVKENWLIIAGLVVIVIVLNSGLDILNISKTYSSLSSTSMGYGGGADYDSAESSSSRMYMDEGFSPEASERKITRTVSGSIEIKRGNFESVNEDLKDYISESEVIIINEGINTIGEGVNKRKTGSYSLKIRTEQYEGFISKVKALGEVQNFNDNLQDITSNYISLEDNIKLEKERLGRYEELFKNAKSIEEKLSLTDRIFEQERTIKYLEESLDNQDQKIEYVTVYLSLNEKESNFVGISIVNIGKIAKSFMDSLNNAIILAVWVIPWIVVIFLGRIIWKLFKKKR